MRHRFAYITTMITFIALLLGNLVVATESGDACGATWPKCNGNFLPDVTNYHQVIEYSHRAFTAFLGIIILINVFVALKKSVKNEKLVKILSFLSLAILVLQSLIGGLNVLLNTPPGFTTIDTTVSLSLLVSLVLLTTALRRKPVETIGKEEELQQKNLKKLFYPAIISFSLYYFEVIVGAFFKHSAASKVLLNIPVDEQLIYSNMTATLLYNSHGIINTIVVVSSLWLLFYAYRYQTAQVLSVLFLIFILLTGLTGFISVSTDLGIASSSAHMIVSTITISIGAILIGKTGFGDYVIVTNGKRAVNTK